MSQNRKQNLKIKTGSLSRKILLGVLAVLIVAGLVLGILYFKFGGYQQPTFDSNAQKLTENMEIPDQYMFQAGATDYGYNFGFAANLFQQEDQSLYVYFTNPASNNVYLMCEVMDANSGKTYYKSGVIKPGEYIEKLEPATSFKNEDKEVSVKIYAFEKDTWYSGGTSTLSVTMHAW